MYKRFLSQATFFIAGMVIAAMLEPWVAVRSLAQPGCQTFPETGKQVCGRFLEYWQKNGGLAQQGLPLSAEFTEISDLNGQPYTVQYFERAVFEKHPENVAPYDVLLSQLGTFQFKRKYPSGEPGVGATPQPQVTQQPTQPPAAAVQEFKGHGDQATQNFQLKAGAARFHFTHNGRSNFIVHLLDNTGHIEEFLVNDIGPYDGTTVKNIARAGAYILEIKADGDWVITISQ